MAGNRVPAQLAGPRRQQRQTVGIQVTDVGPELQFVSASVGPAAATSVEEKQNA